MRRPHLGKPRFQLNFTASALSRASLGLVFAVGLAAGCSSASDAAPLFEATGGSPMTTGGFAPDTGGLGAGGSTTGGLLTGTGGDLTATGGMMTAATGGDEAATGGMMTGGMMTGGDVAASGGTVTGTTNDCCPDGNCVCRGPEPTEEMLTTRGPFTVEMYTEGFPKNDANHRFLAGTIYYPSDAEGPLSVIVLCPGFTATQNSSGSVGQWGPFFASHGFVTMTIDTLTTGDGVDMRDDALLDALASAKGENTREGSPLKGKLSDTRFGLGGWSMGGGGTGIAVASDPSIKTAMGLAAHHYTVPGYLTTYPPKITAPTILFAGETDPGFLGGNQQSQQIYEAIPASTPKILFEMAGLDHFEFGTPRTNGGALGIYGVAFQKTFLEGDERYRKFLLVDGPNASDWRSNLQ